MREYLWRIADTYERMACFPHAEAQLRELLEMEITQAQRLEALCFLADIQVRSNGQPSQQIVCQNKSPA